MTDAARVRELLSYDPETGVFRWRQDRGRFGNRAKAGDIAGTYGQRGVWRICLDWKVHLGHRLAWLYMTGEWPVGGIDHINGNPSDNRWSNLRPANQSQNNANARMRADNTVGLKGVSRHRGKYRASIVRGGRQKFLGYFATPEEAHAAYAAAAKAIFGEYARSV